MKPNSVLEWAIKSVTALFAMFGGFLTFVAPPEEANSRFAVGLSSFVAVLVLLVVSALVKKRPTARAKRIWLIVAVSFAVLGLGSALAYWWNLNRLTFAWPPENTKAEFVGGTRLTSDAQQYKNENPEKTISTVVADYGGMEARELVWPPEAMRLARMILIVNYIGMVLFLTAAIFSLSEGLLSQAGANTGNIARGRKTNNG